MLVGFLVSCLSIYGKFSCTLNSRVCQFLTSANFWCMPIFLNMPISDVRQIQVCVSFLRMPVSDVCQFLIHISFRCKADFRCIPVTYVCQFQVYAIFLFMSISGVCQFLMYTSLGCILMKVYPYPAYAIFSCKTHGIDICFYI